jgi:hypothetical protein
MRDDEEDRGFTVTDRRGRTGDAARAHPAPSPSPSPGHAEEQPEERRHDELPAGPVDFSGFLMSLASAAMMHLGEPLPDGRTAPVNLPHAQEMIDLLALLEAKTKGNLTPAESSLLANLLYTLRLRYVEKAR